MRSALNVGLFAAVTVLAACTGSIESGATPDRGATSPDGVPGMDSDRDGTADSNPATFPGPEMGAEDPEVAAACEELDVGVTPLRRLTRGEYNRTVADLLGDRTAPASLFAPDEELLGFAAGLSVSPLLVEQYMNAAEALALQAAADMPKLLGCDPATKGEDACVYAFIDDFGRRAYRRPLAADERTALRGLYATNKTAYGFRSGVELMLQAMLQSPDLLYRVEFGGATNKPEIVALSGYEVATRLSYFMWGTTPTPELLRAAESGELASVAGIERHARALLADQRSHQTVASFHEQWLDLDMLDTTGKDPKVYPEFDDELRTAMREETLRFAEHIVFEDDGTVEALLTSPFSFINAPLATLYGVSGKFGAGLQRADLDPTQRMGLLTQAAVLSTHAKSNQSSPVHRGKFVRERFLCQQLSPPPAGLVIVPPDPKPGASTRERFAEHSSNPTCAGCHRLMDPIGFAFEHYDGIGRYREKDGAFTVDASGEVLASRDADGALDGVIELAERLSQSEEVRECIASQWFVYAFGRSVNNELDRCSRARLFSAFESSGYRIPELLVALTATDAFRYRRVVSEGGAP